MCVVLSLVLLVSFCLYAYVAPPAYTRDLCYPRSRSNDCVYAVSKFAEFCEHVGIDMWMDFGTLLGSVRNGGPIPWDWDADVSIHADDAERLRRLLPSLYSKHCVYYSGEHHGDVIKLFFGSCVVDVFPWAVDELTNVLHPVPEKWSNANYAFPSKFISDGLSLCPFAELMLPCPHNAQELISSPSRYGSFWWVSLPYKLDCYWPIGSWLRWLLVFCEGGDPSKSFSYLPMKTFDRLEKERDLRVAREDALNNPNRQGDSPPPNAP